MYAQFDERLQVAPSTMCACARVTIVSKPQLLALVQQLSARGAACMAGHARMLLLLMDAFYVCRSTVSCFVTDLCEEAGFEFRNDFVSSQRAIPARQKPVSYNQVKPHTS